MSNKLKKVTCLKTKKYFDALFAVGNSVKDYPIRTIFVPFNASVFAEYKVPNHSQVAFSVPKRKFKRAVDRNRIKRQMREAYRLNKSVLSQSCAIIFIYTGKEEIDSSKVHKAMISTLEKIENKLKNP